MRMTHRTHLFVMKMLALALIVTLSGCDQAAPPSPKASGGDKSVAATSKLPDNVLLTEAPVQPTPVSKLRSSAKEGDEVIMRVVVGGRVKPFVNNRAVMTVVDAGLHNVCTQPGDPCKTKWDYCCTAPEELQPHLATVQIVDNRGRPLPVDLAASSKIKPMSTLVIKGKVGPRLDPAALVVNASGIFVEAMP